MRKHYIKTYLTKKKNKAEAVVKKRAPQYLILGCDIQYILIVTTVEVCGLLTVEFNWNHSFVAVVCGVAGLIKYSWLAVFVK